MASLILRSKLATWTRTAIADGDMLATLCMEGASLKARQVAWHPEWTIDDVPPEVQLIVEMLAARTYDNGVDGEISSSIGGVITTSILRDFAAAMQFTPLEISDLERYRGENNGAPKSDTLWVQKVGRGPLETDMYVYDDSGSDQAIPFIDARADGYALP